MINPRNDMIILKGEIKTSNVVSCLYNRNTQKWDVTFFNGKTFSYAYDNVEKLNNPEEIDLDKYTILKDGHSIGDVKAIYAFRGRSKTYYHVVLEGKIERDYTGGEVRLVRSVFVSPKSRSRWEYFRSVSELNNLRNDNRELILKKQFERIGFISEENALTPYLNGIKPEKKNGWVPIFPFGCNTSQYQAVENAINNQLSVIQGPPGTGKTQTILNIIANLLITNKTVQVVSNNNPAIENVKEKLESSKYNLGFIVAMLGKGDNKKLFIENQKTEYPDFENWKYEGNIHSLVSEINELSKNLKKVYADEEIIAKLEGEKSGIIVEEKHFDKCIKESEIVLVPVKLKKNILSASVMYICQALLDKLENGRKFSVWEKIRLYLRHGLRDKNIFKQEPDQVITTLQSLFYEKRLSEIDAEIGRLKDEIAGLKVNTDELTSKSMQYLKDALAKRYAAKSERRIFSEDDFWKNPSDVLAEYPVTLSTTFASKSSLGSRLNEAHYDYLIMDEASQVDVATGVLALSSSLNAVIVGDTKQLPNVITEEDKSRAETIFKQYDLPDGYRYTNSFLQSVLDVVPDIPMTLLREHYRCNPRIINFCNQKFYDGKLVVMTHDDGDENVIKAVTTVAGNHERDHFNQRQVDVIKQEILPEIGNDLSEIGIITPYRKQVEAIRREIPGIEVDTVHKFQGREKDTIIISTVDDEKNDFSDDPYLINVAVSRAKKHLYIVASGNESGDGNINDLISYIRYNNCEVIESKINSIFDYLYKNCYDARMQLLKDKKRVSEYDSENLMYFLIEDSLKDNNRADIGITCHMPLSQLIRDWSKMTDNERKYARNPLTHLDFVLYNKISKKVLAAIEVDGYNYHKEGTKQADRDLLKNSIFEKYDVPLLRFSTTGSGEKERLRELLAKI